MVDLQRAKEFQALDVELLSIAPDPADDWREAGEDVGVKDLDVLLTDPGNKVADSYGVMQWAMGSEPGHTFVLVDENGKVSWIRDYGAPENGGVMYVVPQVLVDELNDHLATM